MESMQTPGNPSSTPFPKGLVLRQPATPTASIQAANLQSPTPPTNQLMAAFPIVRWK